MYNTLTCLFHSSLYIVSVLLAHTAAGNTFTNQCSVTMFSNFVFSLTLSSQNSAFQSYLSQFLSFPPPSVQLCHSFELRLKSFVTVYLSSLVPSTSQSIFSFYLHTVKFSLRGGHFCEFLHSHIIP